MINHLFENFFDIGGFSLYEIINTWILSIFIPIIAYLVGRGKKTKSFTGFFEKNEDGTLSFRKGVPYTNTFFAGISDIGSLINKIVYNLPFGKEDVLTNKLTSLINDGWNISSAINLDNGVLFVFSKQYFLIPPNPKI